MCKVRLNGADHHEEWAESCEGLNLTQVIKGAERNIAAPLRLSTEIDMLLAFQFVYWSVASLAICAFTVLLAANS